MLPSSLRIIDLWYDQNRRTVSDFFGIFHSQYVLMQYSAKYPLAMVDCLLMTYRSDIGAAYDIGCALQPTLMNSSLGPCVRDLNLHLMVGSFHGHAHNQWCQLTWHPLHISGMGHSEGEGCEHIFSSLKNQAHQTRYAMWFHWCQALEEHFDFWNQDKYVALGKLQEFNQISAYPCWGHFCIIITRKRSPPFKR